MIDKSVLRNSRFMFTLAFVIQASSLLTSFISGTTLQDSWISIILAGILSIPLILLYRSIMLMFPDKNFIQVLKLVFGRVLGTIIGILLVWFFVTLTALNISDLGDFAKLTVMYYTPKYILILMCVLISVYAVRKGLNVVTRYSAVFTFLQFAIIGVSIVFLFNQMDFSAFLPIFTFEPIKYVQSTHIVTTIPMGEMVLFLMLTPNIKIEKKKFTKAWFLGAFLGILALFLVTVRDIAVLGNTLHLFSLPGLICLRLVNLGEAFSRLEILFAIALIILLFFKITLLGYVIIIAFAELAGIKSYKNLTLIFAIFVVLYSLTLFPSSVNHADNAKSITAQLWSLFEIIIPLLVLIIAKIRKLPKHINLTKKQKSFALQESSKDELTQETKQHGNVQKGEV